MQVIASGGPRRWASLDKTNDDLGLHRILVRLANRLRSITWASKKAIMPQPKGHNLNPARGGPSGGGPHRAEMPLRTEQVASFADVCCAKSSNCGCSATKTGTWSVMPAGYIEPRKILFHTRLLPHETCGMNRLQESREHSQISPRKSPRAAASCKNSLNEKNGTR